MMYCSSEETKTSNIYRLATILLFFLKKKVKCVSTSSHTLFFFFKFLWLQKMGQQHFFSLIFPLSPEVRGRSLGQRSFGRWWRHEVCVQVRVMLSLLSVRRRCTSVNEPEEHLLGDRVGDTVAHSQGSVVGIRKTFICSLSHKDPAVVLEFAFYNFVVILF